MIDLHTHILPGIDDGPPTLEEAVALARDTVAAGVSVVAATPHVSRRYPNGADAIGAAREALRRALADAGVPLVLRPGAEVEIERAMTLTDAELARLRLGSGRYVMLECPLSPTAADIEPMVMAVLERGHGVLLAHPERSPVLQRDPAQLERLIAHGALTSVTAGAVAGHFGGPARRMAIGMIEDGLAHNLVSDMHDRRHRGPGIVAGLGPAASQVFGLEQSLDWLAQELPAALLDGTPLPPAPVVGVRPPAARRSFWRRALRRR